MRETITIGKPYLVKVPENNSVRLCSELKISGENAIRRGMKSTKNSVSILRPNVPTHLRSISSFMQWNTDTILYRKR